MSEQLDEWRVLFGSRIRQARKMKGISQTKLGEILGISYQQVSKYEKGRDKVSAQTIAYIANALSLPVNYFYKNLTSEKII